MSVSASAGATWVSRRRSKSTGPGPLRDHAFQTCCPFRRALQVLQNLGHFIPASSLPSALACFHSALHFVWRSRAASCFAVGSFLGLVSACEGKLIATSTAAKAKRELILSMSWKPHSRFGRF